MHSGWQESFKLPLQEPDLQISHSEAKNQNNKTVKQTILHCQWLKPGPHLWRKHKHKHKHKKLMHQWGQPRHKHKHKHKLSFCAYANAYAQWGHCWHKHKVLADWLILYTLMLLLMSTCPNWTLWQHKQKHKHKKNARFWYFYAYAYVVAVLPSA